MAFPSAVVRALVPAAIVAGAAGAALAADPALAPVEQHLRAADTMTANFVQTDARNRSLRGTLTLKRPGKVRFEYGGGANMLLVGNGKTLNFIDYDVGQKSVWPIAKSPLSVLLADSPDLSRIASVVPSGDKRVMIVRARDPKRPEFGTLLLAFVKSPAAPGGLMLEGWTAIDAQNKRTTVRLDSQRYNVAVADATFRFRDPTSRGPRG
jgi:outer membrane lipoprotein-sorting protein